MNLLPTLFLFTGMGTAGYTFFIAVSVPIFANSLYFKNLPLRGLERYKGASVEEIPGGPLKTS
jgi:hypothetical protein